MVSHLVTVVAKLCKNRKETAIYKRRNNTQKKYKITDYSKLNTNIQNKTIDIKGILNNISRNFLGKLCSVSSRV